MAVSLLLPLGSLTAVLTHGGAPAVGAPAVGAPVSRVVPDPRGQARPLVALNDLEQAHPVHLAPATAPPAPAPARVAAAPQPLARHEVFGFAPYWTLPSAAGFPLSSLTTLAYFSVDVGPDGALDHSGPGWAGFRSADLAQLVNAAHAAGDRVVLTATCFDQPTLDTLVRDPSAAGRLAHQLAVAVAFERMDGVNLDFEGNGAADRAPFAAFVASVAHQLHQVDPHWQLTVDTYAGSAGDPNGFFDIPALAPAVDGFFVMAYDMEQAGAATPNAALDGYSPSDAQAVAAYKSVVAPAKVILGVPFYGYDWATADDAPNALAVAPPTPLSYAQIAAAGNPQYWDARGSVPWAAYQVGGQWHEIWFDDPASLARKVALADASHLGGIGVWALGMDGNDPAMAAALLGQAGRLELPLAPPGPVSFSAGDLEALLAPGAAAQAGPAATGEAGLASSGAQALAGVTRAGAASARPAPPAKSGASSSRPTSPSSSSSASTSSRPASSPHSSRSSDTTAPTTRPRSQPESSPPPTSPPTTQPPQHPPTTEPPTTEPPTTEPPRAQPSPPTLPAPAPTLPSGAPQASRSVSTSSTGGSSGSVASGAGTVLGFEPR